MKVCIFPNDPILAYYNKGEIKDRYYNPNNFFDEIYIISLTENDIEESKVQILAGNAKLKIHSVGSINLKNKEKYYPKIENLVKQINPDVIRAFSPYISGWLAAKTSEKLKIPFYLSLHTQVDYNRKLIKKSNLKKYIALKISQKFIEPYVIQRASKITIVYKIIEPYVIRNKGKKPEVLHNRIDYDRFLNSVKINNLEKPLIISVGSLIPEKNHSCLINAMSFIDAHLLIIGNGKEYDKLIKLIDKKNLRNKVQINKSVPHNEIQNYYKSADIFALAYDPNLESIPMPVMEAMATGLPVVIPYPVKGSSEGLEEISIFSKRDSNSFAMNINRVLTDNSLYKKLSKASQDKAKEYDSKIIELREKGVYEEIISK
jgi:glycosyltransferase involved in cell wall biosynthesis